MAASTHKVEVVPVALEPHPNADSLSIVRIFSGYTCCVRTSDWKDGDLAAYIPPDSLVDTTRPEFQFLARVGHTIERIKVKKLRGIVSMGLLVKAPDGASVGDDVAAHFEVTHYEPPEPMTTGGESDKPPPGYRPVYDVEALRRYGHVLQPGELVVVHEKIHGTSGRWTFVDGRMHVGSRTEWKRERDDIVWWKAFRQNTWIEEWCRANPEFTLYGEVFGRVQDLRYGRGPNEFGVAIFDILDPTGQWVTSRRWHSALHRADDALRWVPSLGVLAYDLGAVLALAEGLSLIDGAEHVREGAVVRPVEERTHPEIGRVILKVIGNGYMERA